MAQFSNRINAIGRMVGEEARVSQKVTGDPDLFRPKPKYLVFIQNAYAPGPRGLELFRETLNKAFRNSAKIDIVFVEVEFPEYAIPELDKLAL